MKPDEIVVGSVYLGRDGGVRKVLGDVVDGGKPLSKARDWVSCKTLKGNYHKTVSKAHFAKWAKRRVSEAEALFLTQPAEQVIGRVSRRLGMFATQLDVLVRNVEDTMGKSTKDTRLVKDMLHGLIFTEDPIGALMGLTLVKEPQDDEASPEG